MINIKYQVKETNHISKLNEYTWVGDVNKGEGENGDVDGIGEENDKDKGENDEDGDGEENDKGTGNESINTALCSGTNHW